MANLDGSSGVGSVHLTNAQPVVGNLDFPFSAADLVSGTVLTTGDLASGDAGEWGGLVECAVEFLIFVHPAGSVPLNVTFMRGPRATGGTVAQWGMQFNASNQLQFWIVRNDGVQVFANAVGPAMVTSRWYHIVGTLVGNNIYTAVDGVISAAISFAGGSVQTSSFTATVADMRAVGAGASDIYIDEWSLYRHGLTAARIQAHYDAARNRGYPQQASGTRIGAVLDTVSSHAPRSIQAGARTVTPRYMSGQSPLEEIRLAVEADDVDAGFFAAADGTLTFLQDGHRSSAPYNADKCVFGDAGGSELPYVNIEVDYSLTDVVNSWSGIRVAYSPNGTPVTQTVSDATSISATGGTRPQVLSDIPVTSDADALAIVTGLLAKYKNPLYRITAIEPNLFDPNTAAAVMTLELMDRVRVKWTPPGGGSRIDQVVYIQQIQRSGVPGVPQCKLVVSPL